MYTNLLFLKNEYIKFCACMIGSIVRLILVSISIYQTNSTCEILKTEARNNYNGIRTFRVESIVIDHSVESRAIVLP